MQEILKDAIKLLRKKGVDYADIRKIRHLRENVAVKNDAAENISIEEEHGIGIRVLYKGCWGFCSTSDLIEEKINHAALEAIEIAKSSNLINKQKVKLSPAPAVVDKFKTNYEVDPFQVPLDKKLDYLFWACQILNEHENIRTAVGCLEFHKIHKLFLNTEGSHIEQDFLESGGYIEATATLGDEFQKRSYPNSHSSQLSQEGFEYVKKMDFVGGAEKIKKEAVALLRAKEMPKKITTVILDSSQMALQIHESCGHPIELDRVLGDELSFAGSSFLTPEKLGKFRYGSKLVNIVADATAPGGLGTFGYDDEGTKAHKNQIIKNGLFVGYLSSRETAAKIGHKSTGAMRCAAWNMTPIIRMTNINLEPGDATLEELISDTKDGVFMTTNKSWSIDERRLNFQFGAEIAWEIKNGKLGQIYKNPVYTGITPEFWNSCSGIANKNYWQMWGVPNCAKGEPIQVIHVGHGSSPARLEKVQVG